MKFFLAVAAFVGLASAQNACLSSAEAIPSCGQACLTSAASSQGCMYTDFACQCSHSAQIQNQALFACVSSACTNAQDVMAVSSEAQAVCGCVASAGPASAMPTNVNAAIPSSTHAIPVSGPSPTNNPAAAPTSAAATAGPAMTLQTAATSTKALSKFTGGAATMAGSFGGVAAGLLGLIAAL